MRNALVPWIVASALVVLGVAFALRSSAEPADVESARGVAPSAGPVDAEPLAAVAPDDVAERTAPRASPRSPDASGVPAEPTVRGALRVRVVADEDDRPLAGVEVWTGSRKLDRTTPAKRTDADGVVLWTSIRDGRYAIHAEIGERRRGRADARVSNGGGTTEVLMRLVANALDGEYRVRLVDARGDATAESLGLDAHVAANLALGLSAACAAPGDVFDPHGAPTFRSSQLEWGGRSLAWKLELNDRDARACAHVLLGDVVLAARTLPPLGGEVVLHVDRDEVRRALSPLVVRVVSRDGRAGIADALVRVVRAHRVHGEARTDAGGLVRFERAGAGEVDVGVIAAGYATATARVRRPFPTELEIALDVGHAVDGTAVQDGRPVAGAKVRAFSPADSRLLDVVVTDPDGLFAFRALPGTSVVVCLDPSPLDERARAPERVGVDPACARVEHVGGAHGVVLRRPAR